MSEDQVIGKHTRVLGEQRSELGRELASQYEGGATIRELANKYMRSYGFVHRVLVELNVTFRPRGGIKRNAEESAQ